jgi:hypothetical protein
MQRVRELRSLESISLEVQGGEIWYFDSKDVLAYSLKGKALTVVLRSGYELPDAKDEDEVDKFLEQMEKVR